MNRKDWVTVTKSTGLKQLMPKLLFNLSLPSIAMVHQQLMSWGESVFLFCFVGSKLVCWYCSVLWCTAPCNQWAKEFASWIQSSHPTSNLMEKRFRVKTVFHLGAWPQVNCGHCRITDFFTVALTHALV